MADHIAPADPTTNATPDHPLLAASAQAWAPTAFAAEADFVLGYESAHPWALGEDDDHAAH